MKRSSELSNGFRPVRMLFREERGENAVHWYCRLCPFSYWEPDVSAGWPLSIGGLLVLVKHSKSHIAQ